MPHGIRTRLNKKKVDQPVAQAQQEDGRPNDAYLCEVEKHGNCGEWRASSGLEWPI